MLPEKALLSSLRFAGHMAELAAVTTKRRRGVLTIAAIAFLTVGVGTGWAISQVFAPRADVVLKTPFTYVELANGDVGSSITLNTVVQWERTAVGTNQARGTVTALRLKPGDVVAPGAVLYEVDLRPVVAAAGATPAFRTLEQGAEGADVAQLQVLLAGLGFFDDESDGVFGWATREGVKAWQESLGLRADGVVQAGDVIFVPELPSRLVLDTEAVFRGAMLSGGEAVVSGLAAEPVFTVPATTEQASMMPAGTRVEITIGDALWVAVAAGQEATDESADQVNVLLQGQGGASVCGDSCGLVPIDGQNLLRSRIITQETLSGVVAPSAALLSDADGALSVVDEDGREHPVEVVGSARGMSVIEGVDAGLKVRVPAITNEATG